MTHNVAIEIQTKCRRLFYAKASHRKPGERQILAGDVIGTASGGGAIAGLTGDALIVATYNDHTASEWIGCIEEYYNPIPASGKTLKPVSVDLSKVKACSDAVTAHRAAVQEKADFILECGVQCGSGSITDTELRRYLKISEIRTRLDSVAHDDILLMQTKLDAYCAAFDDCSGRLLETRDAAIRYADAPPFEA